MENKNKRKFSARGVVAFLAFWLLVGSFFFIFQTCTQALDPTPALGSVELEYPGTLSQDERANAISLVNTMSKYGNFNNLTPISLYSNGESVYLVASQRKADGSPGVLPSVIASQVSISSPDNQYSFYLFRLVENGFGLRSRIYSLETSIEQTIALYDSNSDSLSYNAEYVSGTPATLYTMYNFNLRWRDWEFSAGNGGSGDGDQIIVNELDIGSIIASLPQAARNILDSAFGFELFGINIAATLTAVLIVAIVAFVIKWLMSR